MKVVVHKRLSAADGSSRIEAVLYLGNVAFDAEPLFVDAFVLGNVFESTVVFCAATRPPEEALLTYAAQKHVSFFTDDSKM